MKKINKNIQEEINELNQFFEDMKKSLFKEYSEKDFEEMEKEYILSEKKKERSARATNPFSAKSSFK